MIAARESIDADFREFGKLFRGRAATVCEIFRVCEDEVGRIFFQKFRQNFFQTDSSRFTVDVPKK